MPVVWRVIPSKLQLLGCEDFQHGLDHAHVQDAFLLAAGPLQEGTCIAKFRLIFNDIFRMEMKLCTKDFLDKSFPCTLPCG